MKVRRSTEDYLKTIYTLSQTGEVYGSQIAEAMGFSRATVCVALKALVQEGYVSMDENRKVHLTKDGFSVAQDVLDRHQTFYQMLIALGVTPEVAVRDACKMEHAVSEESFQALKNHMVRLKGASENE